MKLKNKKTGEIGKPRIEYQEIYVDTENHMTHCYKTLHGMFEEWEDYEEPKKYWYINAGGQVNSFNEEYENEEETKATKEIGNYFETREEAEKAVKRLRAWKRLKDKGFRFEGWGIGGEYGITITFSDYIEYNDETRVDLDLLFGGEE